MTDCFNPVQTSQMCRKDKIRQRLWEFVRPVAFGCSPYFARRWRIFWLKLFGAKKVVFSASVWRRARVDFPWNLSLGERSSIADGAWIYAMDKISVGRNCCLSESAMLLTGTHDVSSPRFDLVTKPIVIGDNVWIGAGAMILPGVIIGEGAVIGAGAVVTKDVPSWVVVAGNPAKVIKKRELHQV